MANGTAVQAAPNQSCFGCGRENPHGLRIRFDLTEAGHASAEWTPPATFESFRGVIHGGIVSTVLDEAMSKAVVSMGWPALTCELRVRLRRHVATGETIRVRARVVERTRRKITTEAELTGPDGVERAHAWAVFLVLRDGV